VRRKAEGFDYRELNVPKEEANVYVIKVDVDNEEAFQRSMQSEKVVDNILSSISDGVLGASVIDRTGKEIPLSAKSIASFRKLFGLARRDRDENNNMVER
jgi:hypothetical protein